MKAAGDQASTPAIVIRAIPNGNALREEIRNLVDVRRKRKSVRELDIV